MYGETSTERDDKPASPMGVRIVVIILLLSGLALAALPLTVLLTGGEEPGRIGLRNASGKMLRSVRVVRTVGTQARLVGSAHEVADGAEVEITFDSEGSLRLHIEFDTAAGHHAVPLVLTEPVTGDFIIAVEISPEFGVSVSREPISAADESSSVPHPSPPAPLPDDDTPDGTEVPAELAVAPGPFDLPEGWSEKWRPWFAHVDWVVGAKAGMEQARASGKPMMMFYTATW